MIPVAALAFAGVPPVGLGLYGRGRRPDGPWRYFAQPAGSERFGDLLFVGPTASAPNAWRTSLANALARNPAGILLDPETGWSDAPAAEVEAFGAALRLAAVRTRIGVTTHNGLRNHVSARLARTCAGLVFFSPQLYYTPAVNTSFWQHSVSVWGLGRCVPSIAAWVSPRTVDLSTADRFRAYLDSIPLSVGAIAWPSGTVPEHMLSQLRARYAFPSSLLLLPAWGFSWATSWFALVLGALALLALVFAVRR